MCMSAGRKRFSRKQNTEKIINRKLFETENLKLYHFLWFRVRFVTLNSDHPARIQPAIAAAFAVEDVRGRITWLLLLKSVASVLPLWCYTNMILILLLYSFRRGRACCRWRVRRIVWTGALGGQPPGREGFRGHAELSDVPAEPQEIRGTLSPGSQVEGQPDGGCRATVRDDRQPELRERRRKPM